MQKKQNCWISQPLSGFGHRFAIGQYNCCWRYFQIYSCWMRHRMWQQWKLSGKAMRNKHRGNREFPINNILFIKKETAVHNQNNHYCSTKWNFEWKKLNLLDFIYPHKIMFQNFNVAHFVLTHCKTLLLNPHINKYPFSTMNIIYLYFC